MGYLVNSKKLGIGQSFDGRFHSHIERIRKELRPEEVPEQVSFGYNTKFGRDKAAEHFPDVPIYCTRKRRTG